jgi:hypothetical protein
MQLANEIAKAIAECVRENAASHENLAVYNTPRERKRKVATEVEGVKEYEFKIA